MTLSLFVFISVFIALHWLALYSCMRLLAFLLRRSQWKSAYISLAVTVLYLLAMIVTRQSLPDLYRLLLYYMGIVSFGFFISVAFWLWLAVTKMLDKQASWRNSGVAVVFLLCNLLVSGWAIVNFHSPVTVVEYTLKSSKITTPIRLLQLSDVQFGSITRREMESRFQQAYSLKPDLIVFTGDLIDFEQYTHEDFEVLQNSPVPIYFERGNHEFYHDPTRLLSYLEKIGPIRLLLNARAIVGDLEIIGIDFSRNPGHIENVVSGIARDPTKFSILLYHEPRDVEVASTMGFDLLLYGHTHAGQIWPYTWVIDWMYRYGDGMFNVGEAIVYTSDGVALWGPRMRLGSQNEMVMFHLLPDDSATE